VRVAAWAFLCPALLASAGCSTFERDWEQAGRQAGSSPPLIVGRWEGTWYSAKHDTTDRIRALVSRTGDGRYTVRSLSEYGGGIFRFEFESEIVMALKLNDKTWSCRGTEKLGFLSWITGHGTTYDYEAQTDGTSYFDLTYKTETDSGNFRLTRPKAAAVGGPGGGPP
jgi:hypothetical protein